MMRLQNYSCYPLESTSFRIRPVNRQWGYAGNNKFADETMSLIADNPTLDDNFLTLFDDGGDPIISVMGSNMLPNSDYTDAYISGEGYARWRRYSSSILKDLKQIYGTTQFDAIVDLFDEAEDTDWSATASVVADVLASSGEAVMLDAQWEQVRYYKTTLPEGTYLAFVRVRDINQVADDIGIDVYNNDDSVYRNEENIVVEFTAVDGNYAFYSLFFQITDKDITGGDQIRVRVTKRQAGANEIYVDYIGVFPIGNGEDWAQDMAHGFLYDQKNARRFEVKNASV